MRKIYSFLLLFVVTAAFAQIPSGYYNTATGSGYTLKTQLHNIIKDHTNNGYSGLYTTYQTSDIDSFYENDGTILDMYSENPASTDPYNYSSGSTQRCGNYSVEGDCYNREHIIPQSVFNEQSPMVSDAHFITPTDGKVNGVRSNYPHGMVNTATYISKNGGKLGANSNTGYASGYSGTVFEPIDEFKGDIARMYFYFATRYENTIAGYSYTMFDGSSNKSFTTTFLNILLAWHEQDPVNAREIARNDAIYARQNNRNPFIDHPEYVNQIWNTSADSQAPTAPASLASTTKTTTSISVSWAASTDNVGVTGYDIYANGILKSTVTTLNYTITGLTASTSYNIYVNAKDAAGNTSASSNTIAVTTNSNSATATDLLFSEYIEGSGNNKAIEIANATGSAVNLSAYTIKKQTNGAGSWSTGLTLSGTLNTGSKFVIVNSSMSSSCYATSSANISTTATELTFNGNDAVGLFKNGTLIDIIGTFNGGTSNFAIDVTLRRKSTVTSPTTTFNLSSQWDSFSTDTCNSLGSKFSSNSKTEETTEIPTGYYDTATGTGYTLKTQLYNIIKGHTDNGYAGLYVTYETSDIDNFYENDGSVLDMYSENPTGTDPYNYSIATTQRCGNYSKEGDCYNREHIIPQSIFNELSPMRNDAHFITPTDGKVNGIRSNYPHSVVVTPTHTTQNGGKLGESTTAGYTGPVFEPIDDFKGDIARMYFYFATRYENTVAGYSYAMFNGTSNKVFTPAFLSQLIAWHNQDPVSAREMTRNNAIYARQNNRNPFIDHPEYVASVWTTEADDTTPPTAPLNVTIVSSTSNSINLTWSASTDNVGVTSYAIYVNNVLKQNETVLTATITGLTPSTTYSFYVIAKDASNNASTASASVNGTTAAASSGTTSCASESFINIPAAATNYATRTWTGDSGITWTATDARTDQTINTKSICIRNGSLTASAAPNGIGSLTVTTQLKFTGSSGSFNLRVNGNIVGTIPYSTAITTTTVSGINISDNAIISFTDNSTATNRVAFDDLSWTCHSNLGNENFEKDVFSIYPNPSNGDFTIQTNNSNEPSRVEIFSILGQKVFEKENFNHSSITVNNVLKGIYIVRITQDSKTFTKKIIIN